MRPKKGGMGRMGGAGCDKVSVTKCIEEVYSKNYRKYKSGGGKFCNPFLGAVINIAYSVKVSGNDALFNELLKSIDYLPETTYYLWVRPYQTQGSPLIDDSIIEAWGGNFTFPNAKTSYHKLIEKAADLSDKDVAKIHALRKKAKESNSKIASNISSIYRELESDSSKALEREWCDQFRFCIGNTFLQLFNGPPDNPSGIFMDIASSWPGNSLKQELQTTCMSGPQAVASIAIDFCDSNLCGYVVVEPSKLDSLNVKNNVSKKEYELSNIYDDEERNIGMLLAMKELK